MKLTWGYRSFLLLPLITFLILTFFAFQRGRQGPWHDSLIEFWQAQKWNEIQALADNLALVGKSDSESLYFAMMASSEQAKAEKVRHFAELLSGMKVINWRAERTLANMYQPESLLDVLSMYRTRVILICSVLLILFLSLSLRNHENYLTWLSLISTAGSLILIL